ncbi:nucleoside triphosphate pyrophosphohydrolase [Thioalkalivibrio paradoxus]|uniref:nucleoside triphosphate pyrophosphohydrolase n=1 Tax=Thioalkalivibrio paradoxus TaxID=108010 RepID=UPI00022C325A|nr:nucleoside triphosphate pyrophosphohydrolase [Thioalkalivibrio paradoxus]
MDIHDPDPIRRLRAIMARLRDPEGGCPWDRAQTPETIVPYTLEEAYELAEAIAGGETDLIRAELGDLLFQVVFQARLGEEAGSFDLDDIASAIADKLVRRHPHVFGDTEFAHDAEREAAWESAKAHERRERERHGTLDDIPLAMPALARALKLQRRAARVGFDWDEPAAVLQKIREEIREVQVEQGRGAQPERLADEVGDVLFAVVNWARHLGVDPETALRGSNRKFERRFRSMETLATERGQRFASLSSVQLEALWSEIKRSESITH